MFTLNIFYVLRYYKDAQENLDNSEEGFYYMAQFYDKLIGKNYTESDLDRKHGEFIHHVVSQVGCRWGY